MRLSLIVITLIFSFTPLQGQWKALLSGNSLIHGIQNIHYIAEQEAFAISDVQHIYYTKNDFRKYEIITTNLGGSQEIKYFEMMSKIVGIMVTRYTDLDKNQGGFIYVTHNGGYDWKQVHKIKYPYVRPNGHVSQEFLHVKELSNKLYIQFGNHFCYGNKSGEDWIDSEYNGHLEYVTHQFIVYDDSTWGFKNNFWDFTDSHGENWNLTKWDNGYGTNSRRMGNDVIKAAEDKVYRFNKVKQSWETIVQRHAMVVKDIRQLTQRYLIIFYWDWEVEKDLHIIYDNEDKKLIPLDKYSEMFINNNTTHINNNVYKTKGNYFIKIDDRTKSLWKSFDFGQTWERYTDIGEKGWFDAPSISMNDSLQVYLSLYGAIAYSNNNWKTYIVDSIYRYHPDFIDAGKYKITECVLNNQLGSETYLLYNSKAYSVKYLKDSLSFKQVIFRYNASVIIINDISKIGNDAYILGREFGDKNNSLYKVMANSIILEKVFEDNDNIGIGGLLIQNEKFVIFTKRAYCYILNKSNNEMKKVNSGMVHITSLRFINENEFLATRELITFNYNLINDTSSYKRQDNFHTAFLPNNKFAAYGFDGFVLSDDLINYEKDTTFPFYDGYHDVFYWKGDVWVLGYSNLYKSESKAIPEVKCIVTEKQFPNPFKDQFRYRYSIEGMQTIKFEIYDDLGKLVLKEETTNNTGIYDHFFNLSNTYIGTYYLRVISNCGFETFKVIKQ